MPISPQSVITDIDIGSNLDPITNINVTNPSLEKVSSSISLNSNNNTMKGNNNNDHTNNTMVEDEDKQVKYTIRHRIRQYTIPEQVSLIQTLGCHRTGYGNLNRRQYNYHPFMMIGSDHTTTNSLDDCHPYSIVKSCSRSNLSASIAWNPSRIRNMILVVGPGTPASILWKGHDDEDNHDDDDNNPFLYMDTTDSDSSNDNSSHGTTQSNSIHHHHGQDSMEDDNDDDIGFDSESENSNDDDNINNEIMTDINQPFRGGSQQHVHIENNLTNHNDEQQQQSRRLSNVKSSIRHEGCINTACWLNCPWRLSLLNDATSMSSNNNNNTYIPTMVSSYNEIPTQIITSGDDRWIKIWDVQHAMGMISPLPGGWDTYNPLTMSSVQDIGSDEQYQNWKNYYKIRNESNKIAGSVRLLMSIHSKHRGNVFHVTPVGNSPGKVLTCGADGYLRITDLESSSSSIVFNPTAHTDDDDEVTRSMGIGTGGMAFSHQLLTRNTGLLCSERGLFHFDIRLHPNEQHQTSLLQPTASSEAIFGSESSSCKACAVWLPRKHRGDESYPYYIDNDIEPTFIFAGGTSGYVELLDLRMSSGTSSKRVLQRYCPRNLVGQSNISVGGIDVSKDGRELLVSYENDQIYTFPVFPEASYYSTGPTLEEMDTASKLLQQDKARYIPELAVYGGHENRQTFLKNATYAGPNDEYILTGSDSGKAWIYNRSNCSVAALLGADSSICNGIIAHPTLPYFITYGIDSTAKLWRAPSTSDSPKARANATIQISRYDPSPVCRNWLSVESELHRFDDKTFPIVLPDFIVHPEDYSGSSRFERQTMGITGRPMQGNEVSSLYGNALSCLLPLLRKKRYVGYRAIRDRRTSEKALFRYSIAVCWNRLRFQALSLGLGVNAYTPWIFECSDLKKWKEQITGFHPSDLVPDNPSDWILYDPSMYVGDIDPDVHGNFNHRRLLDVIQRHFPNNYQFFGPTMNEMVNKLSLPWLSDEVQHCPDFLNLLKNAKTNHSCLDTRRRVLLYETANVLKEGGNEAMKLKLFFKAAQRYDKAVQYCAIAFMSYNLGQTRDNPFTNGNCYVPDVTDNSDEKSCVVKYGTSCVIVWSPLLRLLIASRMNLSLLHLRPEFNQPSQASDQAIEALRLLGPFVTEHKKIIVIVTSKNDMRSKYPVSFNEKHDKKIVICDTEPIETFIEATTMQSKAYFRLGCAQYEMHDFATSVKSFQSSLDCFRQLDKLIESNDEQSGTSRKPDALLLKRLREAQIQSKKKSKRTQQQYQKFFNNIGDANRNESNK